MLVLRIAQTWQIAATSSLPHLSRILRPACAASIGRMKPRSMPFCLNSSSGSLFENVKAKAEIRNISSTRHAKDEYENAEKAKIEVCYGSVCDKVKTGKCNCYNMRTRRKSREKHLTEAEWRKRCAGCPVFPCLEYDLEEVDCESWRSCGDWIRKEDRSGA